MRFDFSPDVRNALAEARSEALRLGHSHIDRGHLLLGLLASGDATTARLLERCGLAADEVRPALEAGARPRPLPGPPPIPGTLPYTRAATSLVERVMGLARRAGQSVVTSEHLLLALVEGDRGVAGSVMRRFGITAEAVRAAGGDSGDSGTFQVRIDDASDRSIYEQIVAQVQEGIATGALAAGERLPPVRALADRLGIAPGTVARAYAELERMGLVLSQGARGTRVAERRTPSPPLADLPGTLAGLLRPVAVAAFHMGADAPQLRAALEEAMRDILGDGRESAA